MSAAWPEHQAACDAEQAAQRAARKGKGKATEAARDDDGAGPSGL